jgi:hypothetical protein
MPHRPRAERDLQRGRAAARAGTAGSAIGAALAQIAAAFDEAAAINDFKLRIERCQRLGPQHPAVRARFRARAAVLPDCTLALVARGEKGLSDRERAWLRQSALARSLARASAHLAAD